MNRVSFARKVLFLWLCCFHIVGIAQGDDQPQFHLSGFGTLAALGTDTDRLGFVRDRSQLESTRKGWGITNDSRLGLQLDATISQDWNAAVQWVARDHAGDFFEQNLEWAFVRWSHNDRTAVRAGRLGTDLFLLSDYRNVGYTYPWIRPPHEFYANLPVYHFDGLDVAHKFDWGDGQFSVKVFGGHSFSVISNLPYEQFPVSIPVVGVNWIYDFDDWRLRGGYAYLRPQSDSQIGNQLLGTARDPQLNQLIPNLYESTRGIRISDTDIHFTTLSAAYDDGIWQLQAEALYIDAESYAIPDEAAGYVHIGRRFNSLTLYGLFGISQTYQQNISVAQPVLPLASLSEIRQAVESYQTVGIDEKSISLGLRWDVLENVALKAQWSHYWLGNNGTQLWEEPADTQPTPTVVNVMSVGVDFVF